MNWLEILRSQERVLGMSLGFHDYLLRSDLPQEAREHRTGSCLRHKSKRIKTCHAFCGAGGRVDAEVLLHPHGWVHTCPYGLAKVSLPVMEGNELIGVLFAIHDGKEHPDEAWMEDRRVALEMLRSRLEIELPSSTGGRAPNREDRVRQHLEANLEQPTRLGDLAEALGLSPSHTSRWIQSHFKKTFQRLLLEARLDRSALWLARSSRTISEIAVRLQFSDQSHFSRSFKAHHGTSPLRYRKERQQRV